MNLLKIMEKQMKKRMFKPIENYIQDQSEVLKSLPESPEFGFFTWFRIFREKNIDFKYKIVIKAIPFMIKSILGISKSYKTLKNNPKNPSISITKEHLDELEQYSKSIGVDKIGYTTLLSHLIFKDQAVLYKNVIVLIKEMDKDLINLAPSSKTQVMIMKTYYQMGNQANKIAKFLRKYNYSAQAGPALGGLSVYPVLAKNANLGGIGRHGLLITPEFGPRQRIAVVYTDISNLPISTSNSYEWISKFCQTCYSCLKNCPTNAIYNSPVCKEYGRLTHVDVEKCAQGFLIYGCSICIKECTFNKTPYEKLKQITEKKDLL